MMAGLLLVTGLGTAPALTAQDSAWSRLTHRPACPPAESCPWRPGLLWDTTNVMPRYPEVMRQVGIAGSVDFTFAVDSSGRVDPNSIQVVRSTNRAFEPPTFVAAKQWRFELSEAPGRPHDPIPMQFRMRFAIEEGCAGSSRTSHAWLARDARPELLFLVCPIRLVPRDQIRPINGPG